MTTTNAKAWADFFSKLGLPFVKAYVIRFAIESSSDEVWEKYIRSNPVYLAAAQANHFYSPDDVESYFREVSYVHMRSTFPRRSRGRGIIGPHIVSLRILQQSKEFQARVDQIVEIQRIENHPGVDDSVPKDLVGKSIIHTAPDAVSFGKGTITDVRGETLTIDFKTSGKKYLSYSYCIRNKLIEFL